MIRRALIAMGCVVALVPIEAASPVAAAPVPRPDIVAVPSGFTDSAVASVSGPTAVVAMPDSRVIVLEKVGKVRVYANGGILPAAALTLDVCANSEQGLLGFVPDPDYLANKRVFLYYTAKLNGGCVNRVSRFTMNGDVIDPTSELILVDRISARGGNHNGGDLDVGKDGYLYITTGDAGQSPRGTGNAARDLSLLNGKILRVDRTTGEGAPDNPLVAQGAVSCRLRGNDASTPTTPCAEVYSWGLRNPWRFAFDPNSGPQRFFINDVGQGTREEVDEGGAGRDYGWNEREGICPQGGIPPCAGAPAGVTDPITDYGRSLGQYITGAAFVPNGVWPAAYDGAYLFGDGGSGNIWMRTAAGTVDYATPFATGAGGLSDMAFVREGFGYSLFYVGSSPGLRKISYAFTPPATSGPLQFVPVPPGNRILDSRLASAGGNPILAGSTRYVKTGVDGTRTRAVLVSLAYVEPTTPGFLTAWAARSPQPATANVNALAGEVVSNMAIIPVDAGGGILLYTIANAHVVIDLLGTYDDAPSAVKAGRFVPVTPTRFTDTRNASSDTNTYTRKAGNPYPLVGVPVLNRGGIPATGVASVVLVVTAISGTGPTGGFLTATPGGAPWPGSANLNVNGSSDIRPNTVVVPVAADGTIDLHLQNVDQVIVDVAGYFTDSTAASSTSGRFVSLPPTREVDTRIPLGFGRMLTATSSTVDPASVPANAAGLAHNIAIANNSGPGFITPYPDAPIPVVAAGNVTAPGQVRSILTFTKLSAGGTMSYYGIMDTDLVVDVTGYYTG